MKRILILLLACTLASAAAAQSAQRLIDYVNPFIGTTIFGKCNPGAVLPTGLMSVTPFSSSMICA